MQLFVTRHLILSACGGGGGNKISTDNTANTIITNTTSSDTDTNSQNLSEYSTLAVNNFSGNYGSNDKLSQPQIDQTVSETYLSTHKETTTTKQLSGKNVIDGLLYPYWDDALKTDFWKGEGAENKISFSFFDPDLKLLDEDDYTSTDGRNAVYNNDYYKFSEANKIAIKNALLEFEKVIDVKFVEVVEGGNQVGTIRFGWSNSELINGWYAFAVGPGNYWTSSGDIWINKNWYGKDFGPGDYEFSTLLHEIGHAMGLAHPHEGGAQTLTSTLDYVNYTVMSYDDPSWSYSGSGSSRYYTISESLMVYDIQALQYMYGANNDYNSGNTKYEFDPHKPTSLTIWDSGGEDLLDFSNFYYRCDIDLNDGSYSTIRYASWNPEDNFGLAFNTFIENVSGSQANDIIVGNELDNEIMGNNGDDILRGGAGNDIFNWAADSRFGEDTMYGGLGDDVFVLSKSSRDLVIELQNEGFDTVYTETDYTLPNNVEKLIGFGGGGSLALNGNALDNVIRGDTGNDVLTGAAGADDFLLYLGMGDDTVTDFNSNEGDEVLLAYGLTEYEFAETSNGALYNLSDGSSLLLQYEFIA